MRGSKPHLRKAADALTKAPPVPKWFPAEAVEEWRRVVPGMIERRILTKGDLGSLENYCLCRAQIRQCQDTLDAGDHYVQSANSALRPHPAFRVMHSAMTIARQLAAELGLTPVSRSRPAIADEAKDDDWSGLVDE